MGASSFAVSSISSSDQLKPSSVGTSYLTIEREILRIKSFAAQYLLNLPAGSQFIPISSQQDLVSLSQKLLEHLRKEYELRVRLIGIEPFDASRQRHHRFEVEVYGEKFQVQSLKRMTKLAQERFKEQELLAIANSCKHLISRQSAVLTRDWRVVPVSENDDQKTSQLSGANAKSKLALAELTEDISSMPSLSTDRLLELPSLLRIKLADPGSRDKGSTDGLNSPTGKIISFTTSRGIEQTLLSHTRSLVYRLKLPSTVSLHALALLIRLFRFVDDSVVKDATVTITAIVLLAMKVHGHFKHRFLSKAVRSAYCQVFSRDEKDVGSSADSYLPKVFEKELEVYELLHFDLFVPNIEFSLTNIIFNRGTEVGHMEKARLRGMLDESVTMLELIVISYSNLTIAFPWEVMHAACLLIVMALEALSDDTDDESVDCPQLMRILLRCSASCGISSPALLWMVAYLVKLIGANRDIFNEVLLQHRFKLSDDQAEQTIVNICTYWTQQVDAETPTETKGNASLVAKNTNYNTPVPVSRFPVLKQAAKPVGAASKGVCSVIALIADYQLMLTGAARR